MRGHQATVSFLPTLRHQLLKQKCHSKIRVPLPPLPDPEPWLRDFAWGEKKAISNIVSKISPMGLTLFVTEHGDCSNQRCSKNSSGCGGGNWEVILEFSEDNS